MRRFIGNIWLASWVASFVGLGFSLAREVPGATVREAMGAYFVIALVGGCAFDVLFDRAIDPLFRRWQARRANRAQGRTVDCRLPTASRERSE